jgi:hypothetical protein
MTEGPKRVQRKRTKGWRMPANTVSVSRPGPWGNPFVVNPRCRPGSGGSYQINVPTVEDAVACFREMIALKPELVTEARKQLRGKNLACFCALDQPCHADVLLEIANAPICEGVTP